MLQTMTVSCRGGLDLSSNVQELLNRPGEAIQLQNYECSKEGGYRRISGYESFGVPVPGTGKIKGIYVLKDQGLLVCKEDKIYHSFDGTYWLQVNKVSDDVVEGSLGAEIPRSTSEYYTFTVFTFLDEQHVYISDAAGNPMFFRVKGTERTGATYTFREISLDNELLGVSQVEMFKGQLFLAGMPHDPATLYYSSFASTDVFPEDGNINPQEKFTGSTSGFLGVGEDIVGIKSFRETLYIFCENSIWKATGMDVGQPVVEPVTRNIGCVDGHTIQEVGGNLLFLAPDGIRTVAGTEKIGDIELGIVSRKVQPMLDRVLKSPAQYQFRSVVLKGKNQYRLYWSSPQEGNDNLQQGLIAAYVFDPASGGADWNYSEILGWPLAETSGGTYLETEGIFHGDFDGNIYQSEKGNTFGGRVIKHVFQSPYIDFGDIGIRKNVHKVFLTTKPEGQVDLGMYVRYDYLSTDVYQPELYLLESINTPAVWGNFQWGTVSYGARDLPNRDIHTEGSGFTVSIQIVDTGQADAPFDIQSLVYDVIANGRV